MASAAPGVGTSVYVHVPFCVVKCGYCDFNSYVVEDPAAHDLFLAALRAELAMTPLPAAPVSVFIGGGTPSHLAPSRLRQLLELLATCLDLRRCREITMEANPESITAEKAAIARAAGVNRVSMGVQSFAAQRLAFLDRAHDADRARAAFAELRAAGFDNLSIDLMFGLPGETLEEWLADLAGAVAMQPDHLSCYNLTFEPGTRLHRELEQGRLQRNDEEVDAAMFVATRRVLGDAGFAPYEISNFAGRGGPCRHNDHYWLQGDYVGIGPGASSHRAGIRTTNIKPLEAWARSCLGGLRPVATAETLTPRQRAGEAVWLGLRRTEGIDLEQIERRLGIGVQGLFADVIDDQLARGWLAVAGRRIALTAAALLLADRIASAYLTPATGSDA